MNRPPVGTILPPEWPPRPNTFDEVNLGPFVHDARAKVAYAVWSLPDNALGEAWRRHLDPPFNREDDGLDNDVLAYNVHEHLMTNPVIPPSTKDAQDKFAEEGLEQKWDTSELLKPLEAYVWDEVEEWNLEVTQSVLKGLGLSTTGSLVALQKRYVRYVLERGCGIGPRSNLDDWGIERPDQYALQPVENEYMSTLDMYTFAIKLSPYNLAYWLSRAYCRYQQAYFDLAIGDAYRAQLLCDVVDKAKERTRRRGLYPRVWHAIEKHLMVQPRKNGKLNPEMSQMREPNGINSFIPCLRKTF
jgi:hypothetical protein